MPLKTAEKSQILYTKMACLFFNLDAIFLIMKKSKLGSYFQFSKSNSFGFDAVNVSLKIKEFKTWMDFLWFR